MAAITRHLRLGEWPLRVGSLPWHEVRRSLSPAELVDPPASQGGVSASMGRTIPWCTRAGGEQNNEVLDIAATSHPGHADQAISRHPKRSEARSEGTARVRTVKPRGEQRQ